MSRQIAIQAATALMRKFEGLHLRPYLDPIGIPTIGYGATYYRSGRRVKLSDPPITNDEAEQLLIWMVETVYMPGVIKLCPGVTDPLHLAALIDFAFNLGLGNLRSSTLRKRVNARQWSDVPAQFRRWVRAAGQVLRGLVRRREAEIDVAQFDR
jgi:lysozyme